MGTEVALKKINNISTNNSSEATNNLFMIQYLL